MSSTSPADGARLADAVATTLVQVRAEREALRDELDQAVAQLARERTAHEAIAAEAERTIEALTAELQAARIAPRSRGGFLARMRQGGGSIAPDPVVEEQRAAISDLEQRLEDADARALEAAQARERVEGELTAQLEQQRDELAVAHAALDELRARVASPPGPARVVLDADADSQPNTADLIARLGAAHSAALGAGGT